MVNGACHTNTLSLHMKRQCLVDKWSQLSSDDAYLELDKATCVKVLDTRVLEPSRTVQFGIYRTVPTKNRYGLVLKNGSESQTIKNDLNRTSTDRFGPIRVGSVWYGPVHFGLGSVWSGSAIFA